jgi:hypothetical protein
MNAAPALFLATFALAASAAADTPPIVCTPNPIACEPAPASRFDPQFQRFLVERKLELQPSYWTTVYFYLPPLEARELEELQIRYIAELLAREEAKQRAAAE